jgi:Fe-S-cluster-containing dehydrogenase component
MKGVAMSRNGLLIEYEYCTGCHACEVACKQEHNFSSGMVGIIVNEVVTESSDKVNVDYIPYTTRFCDLCADRTKKGEPPACVKHCQAICMKYGDIAELAKEMEAKPRSILLAPR